MTFKSQIENFVYPSDIAYLFLDGIYLNTHSSSKRKNVNLNGVAITRDGNKIDLPLMQYKFESPKSYDQYLKYIKSKGVKNIDVIITDNTQNLSSVIKDNFPETMHQVCLVHKIMAYRRWINEWSEIKHLFDFKELYQLLLTGDENQIINYIKPLKSENIILYRKLYRDIKDERNFTHLKFQTINHIKIHSNNIAESSNARLIAFKAKSFFRDKQYFWVLVNIKKLNL